MPRKCQALSAVLVVPSVGFVGGLGTGVRLARDAPAVGDRCANSLRLELMWIVRNDADGAGRVGISLHTWVGENQGKWFCCIIPSSTLQYLNTGVLPAQPCPKRPRRSGQRGIEPRVVSLRSHFPQSSCSHFSLCCAR